MHVFNSVKQEWQTNTAIMDVVNCCTIKPFEERPTVLACSVINHSNNVPTVLACSVIVNNNVMLYNANATSSK